MAIEPKTTREHIVALYGHISGVKKNIHHMHKGIHELGWQDRQNLLGSFSSGGSVAILLLERFIT